MKTKNYKSIKILNVEEMNEFYDPRKTHNGGGYHQPLYTFEFDGKLGYLHDSSCGDFGTRYYLLFDDRLTAKWGTLWNEGETYSSPFTDEFVDAFFVAFGVTLPVEEW